MPNNNIIIIPFEHLRIKHFEDLKGAACNYLIRFLPVGQTAMKTCTVCALPFFQSTPTMRQTMLLRERSSAVWLGAGPIFCF